ncbi:MAG: Gp15 family bacteriophage protein [Eubacteriales bacterium]|nr:Gp15 family bacteriophage protein [Eubacteriales bacterium]
MSDMKFNPWRLPQTMEVGGESYEIRTDFRDILTILTAFGDPELDDYAKQIIMLKIIYPNWKNIPEENLPEAAAKAASFIDCGQKDDGKQHPKLVDWEKDASILIPSINTVAGEEIRAKEYLHWWTFLGYYMEIREGLFAQVVTIRQKKAKGKKLEDYEREFYSSNKNLVELEMEEMRSEEEKAELNRLFGLKK